MEKNVVLAIGLTVGLYVVYLSWFAPRPVPLAARPLVAQGTAAFVAQGTTARVARGTSGSVGQLPESPAMLPAAPGVRQPSAKYAAVPDVKLSNLRVELTIGALGGAVKLADAWACLNPSHAVGDRSVTGDPGATSASVTDMPGTLSVDLLSAATDIADPTKSNWKLVRSEDAVAAQFEVGGLTIVRTIRLSSDPAHPWGADVVYTVRNDSAPVGSVATIEIVGPVLPRPAMPDDGVLIAQFGEDGDVEELGGAAVHKALAENPRVERIATSGRFAWIGARADFYLGALIPTSELPAKTTVGFRAGTRIDDPKAPPAPAAAATFRIPYEAPAIGQEVKYEFTLYCGPNERTLLHDETSPYHVLKGATVSRGFLGLKLAPIARLMSWLLGMLAGTGMGYGLAVIALTICVRGLLFPLSRKSQISMRVHAQKMQRLKPKLDAIKAKHKDTKKQQEMTMKVMREEKVGLLPGGCLLAFLQMPIWISLYSVLQTTFEMRHADFLWVKDLTAPDHLAHMQFLEGWPLLPVWLNLLPLLMMVVWYLSAAMQPLPTDPQQASQAKMMRWMPVLMGIFLYNTAAGLTLYMTMSALWSIGETWLIRKLWLNKLEAALK